MTETTEIAVASGNGGVVPLESGGGVAAIVPQSAEQAFRMAQMIARSGMAPKDMNSPDKIVAAIFHGLEVGLKPLQAVQSIAVINGRPTIWGDAAIGLVQGSGLLEDMHEWIEGEGEQMTAWCEVRRIGWKNSIKRSFSADDAKTAGLWTKTGPWKQYPKRMTQMRARAFALRDGFADVLKGLQIREEVRDYTAAPVASGAHEIVTAEAIIAQAEPEAEPAEDVAIVPEPEREAPAPDEKPAPLQFTDPESKTHKGSALIVAQSFKSMLEDYSNDTVKLWGEYAEFRAALGRDPKGQKGCEIIADAYRRMTGEEPAA